MTMCLILIKMLGHYSKSGNFSYIEGDQGGKPLMWGHSMSNCEKNVHMNMCLILSGYRNRAVLIY
jgi:hypothetical protein